MYSQLKEKDLVDKVVDGNLDAFNEFVSRYEKTVSSVVIGMLGKSSEAEEIAQDVFIKFYQTAANFRKDSGIKTYLTRIAINMSLNELKRRKRQSKIFSLNAQDYEIEKVNYTDIDNYELKEAIEKALQTLELKKRSVAILRLVEGYSTEETAKILSIPMGTVLSRLSRAVKELKILLKDYL